MPIVNGVYQCDHFCPEEFMSPEMYKYCSDRGLDHWRFIPEPIGRTADQMWEDFNCREINTWKWNGNKQFSGFHFLGEYRGARTLSGHPWGRSLDMRSKTWKAADIRREILGRSPEYPADHMKVVQSSEKYPHITEIEFGDLITWLHLGFFTNVGGILLYAPKGA